MDECFKNIRDVMRRSAATERNRKEGLERAQIRKCYEEKGGNQ